MEENNTQKSELNELIIIGIVMSLLIGLVINGFLNTLKFTWAYLFMFYIPLLPWIYNRKESLVEKVTLINVLGLITIPLLLAMVGAIVKLNLIIYILVPLLTFSAGIIYQKYKRKN